MLQCSRKVKAIDFNPEAEKGPHQQESEAACLEAQGEVTRKPFF